MKKVLLIGLSIIMLLSLVACGKTAEKEAPAEVVEQEDTAEKEAPAEVPAEKEKLTIGTSASYYPWAFQKDDKLDGFEVDVWNEIAKRADIDLDFKLANFSGLVGMLDSGEIDSVAHQMSITPAREEKYYFTAPYAYSFYDFCVREDSPIKELEDLKGKKVGCWLGGNGEATLRAVNDEHDLNLDIVTYDGVPMEKEVELGRIDATWQGEIKTVTTVKENELPLRMLGQKLTFEVNAYPFVKGEETKKLTDKIAKIIEEMREDGTLVKLSEKWFNLDTVNNPKG